MAKAEIYCVVNDGRVGRMNQLHKVDNDRAILSLRLLCTWAIITL